MASVTLPKLPKGKEFEEYVSAIFQSGGHYVERQIIERGVEEVLELDIVVTDYDQSPPRIVLLEVKSGDWGFPDLFKLKGWMDYLNFTKSALIINKHKSSMEFFQEKAGNLGVDLVLVTIKDDATEKLRGHIEPSRLDKTDIEMWRFSYWVERRLMERLKQQKKSQKTEKRHRAIEDYYFKTNSGIFFTENIIERLTMLYSAFQEHPLISAKCGNEMVGNDFDEPHQSLPNDIYSQTYYECKLNDIQVSTFVEHRARIAILKNAIDYALYSKAGDEIRTSDVVGNFLGLEYSKFASLPNSFKSGLETICKEPYCHRYPIFWQWFMWLFGGFILKDMETKEYETLSEKTGIPLAEIPNALKSYETLFPHHNGWFMDLPTSNIRMLNLFPVPFRGIGANYRRLLYTETGKLNDLNVGGPHTKADLAKWNNLTVKVLGG